MNKKLLISALLLSDVSAETCTENNLQAHCPFVTADCSEICALAVMGAINSNPALSVPSPEEVLADSLPTGFDITALSSGDPTALMAAAGVELPAGLDANAIAGLASGDLSGLDLNALTGGMIPEGIDMAVIQKLIGGDLTALAELDITALMKSLGVDLATILPGIDLAAIIAGLLGTNTTSYADCDSQKTANNWSDTEYNRCKADKDYADEQAVLAAQKAEDDKFVEAYEKPRIAANGLECTMDGMVDMTQKTVELLILPITLCKELLALALQTETGLQTTVQLFWTGFLGSTFWGGYALYAVYAFGLDYGFSNETCDGIDYLYLVVKEMAIMTTFAQSDTTAASTTTTA